MSLEYSDICLIAHDINQRYKATKAVHPLIDALNRLGVRNQTIAHVLGVSLSTLYGYRSNPLGAPEDHESVILYMLLVSIRHAQNMFGKLEPDLLAQIYPPYAVRMNRIVADLQYAIEDADSLIACSVDQEMASVQYAKIHPGGGVEACTS